MASLGTWPSSLIVSEFDLDLQTNQRVNASPGGGSEQAVDMLNDRWMCSLVLPVRNVENAGAVEAFLASFRGQVNTIDLWHFARPSPRGTMAGSPTLYGSHAQGAAAIQIQTTAGATLLAGDMVTAGGLLLMVAADATANGSGILTVNLVNRLRFLLSGGADVTWDKPTAPFRLLSHSSLRFASGLANEVDLVLGEAI